MKNQLPYRRRHSNSIASCFVFVKCSAVRISLANKHNPHAYINTQHYCSLRLTFIGMNRMLWPERIPVALIYNISRFTQWWAFCFNCFSNFFFRICFCFTNKHVDCFKRKSVYRPMWLPLFLLVMRYRMILKEMSFSLTNEFKKKKQTHTSNKLQQPWSCFTQNSLLFVP